ncbi:MAG: lipoyl synthase [Geobacteraceae bacterium]|nr:lipoyl synthase [Geobacteraceae bacterium]
MKIQRKPEWLRKKVNLGEQVHMRHMLGELRLNTVCQQALCPNISECFSCGQATFLILGTNCTRQCSFCNVEKNVPQQVDIDEPDRIAEAVVRLKLSHVVITSPTRDDLPDGGASHYFATVSSIKKTSAATRIEVLIPDFLGNQQSLKIIIGSRPDIIAHNVETVPRLYHVRSGADYQRSLQMLKWCREQAPLISTKSGVMLGMGEHEDEVVQVIEDLRGVNCTYLSIGQYLAPSKRHYPVQEYIQPEVFVRLRDLALKAGFSHVESGPYVRSSYHAGQYT